MFTRFFAVMSSLLLVSEAMDLPALFGGTQRKEPYVNPDDPSDYGVDVSFPMHHRIGPETFFGKRYHDSIKGCYDKFSRQECDANEDARVEMNKQQPASQYNYTELGFKKTKVPEDIWKKILKFYTDNQEKEHLEKWPRGNTYTNNWESPTYMISFEDKSLRGGSDLKQEIWDAIHPVISEWTGKQLEQTSLYGIRVYRRGAVLATHVDRLPLVSSCIIQVAQDVDTPWPVEVISHDGKAYNFTMQPQDMVLYESHTVLHGRPFPLDGNMYANIFVHFQPVDHDENNKLVPGYRKQFAKMTPSEIAKADRERRGDREIAQKERAQRESGGKIGGHEQFNHEPAELERHMARHRDKQGDEEEGESVEDRREHMKRYVPSGKGDGRTALHQAAAKGNLERIEEMLSVNSAEIIHSKDENQWQPIHEAARGGHLDVLKYLIDMGADIGSKTSNGGTPLWWARKVLDEDHEVVQYLLGIGAPDEGDEF